MVEDHQDGIDRAGGAGGVDRRALLRGVGLGALAGALPLMLRSADATAAPRPSVIGVHGCGPLPLIDGPEFPIGAFWPPPPYQTTVRRYAEMKDAGFTFMLTGNYLNDAAILTLVLATARQVGLKVLVASDPEIDNMARNFTISDNRSVPMSISTADATALVNRALTRYQQFSSFAGFSLYDEPGAAAFPSLGKAFTIVRNAAPTLLPHANLIPGEGAWYRDFVQSYMDTVAPPVLSYDRYPLLADGTDDPEHFHNMAIIRDIALAKGVPFWLYIQSVRFNNRRIPTTAEVYWQVNAALAYGCKGIKYFTYWTPERARGEDFSDALITVEGAQTPLYGAAREVNTTWLSPVGAALKPLISERAMHANERVPNGAAGFTPDAYLTATGGSPALIGQFRDGSGSRTRWLFVANRSHRASATVTLTLDTATVARVALYHPATREYRPQPAAGQISVALEAGAAALYRLEV